MKKGKLLVLSSIIVTGLLSGCNNGKNNNSATDTPTVEEEKEEVITFSNLVESMEEFKLQAGETRRIEVNEEIGDKNYLQILLKTTHSIKGAFTYYEIGKMGSNVKEEFFIESTEGGNKVTDFRQFLDAFRPEVIKTGKSMSVGAFEKVLKSIEFTNYSDEEVSLKFEGLNISPRQIPEEDKLIYLEKDSLKIGMDLLAGGTFSYLERVDYDGDSVDLVVDKDNNVRIGVDYASRPRVEAVSNHVNLINIYDAGRQIQQSYYASIGGYGISEEEKKDRNNDDGGTQNGYTRNISTTADKNGYYWPYNPVQGGDEVVNFSQIIDFRKTKDTLYCKTRALDWAGHLSGGNGNPQNNRVTKSYMENTFQIKDGMVFATNRFIDWNGFYDLENIPGHNIEIPATYIVQPFNVYQAYLGDEPFKTDKNGNLDTTPGILEKKDNLGPWKNGGHKTNQHKEDWFAWTNNEDFGVGVYIPGATYYSSGRSCTGIGLDSKNPEGNLLNVGANGSPMVNDYRYNKEEACCDFDPCYVRNTSYTAPVKAVKLKEYIPLEYQYVVAVDYVPAFREQFKELYEAGEVSRFNDAGLNAWN